MKTMRNFTLLLILFYIVVMPLSACSAKPKQYTQASWTTHYNTVEEMTNASDEIIIAKVISQSLELRVDMVFTISELEIVEGIKSSTNNGSTLSVLQTGGKKGDFETYPIEDVLMLSQGKTYLLFLDKTDEGHTLLMGGYQGAATIQNGKVVFPDNEAFTQNKLDRLTLDQVKQAIKLMLNQ